MRVLPPKRRSRAAPRAEPLRTCVGCRQVKPRSQLHRIGLDGGVVVVNPRRVSGRSAYLCSDEHCWTTAEKRRAIDRALETRISAEDWARLREGILT